MSARILDRAGNAGSADRANRAGSADSAPGVASSSPPAQLPPAGRAALRAGVVGNWIDNIHVFLPLIALSPALATVAGPTASASAEALVVIAMLLGRPVGGVVLGRVADRLGRTGPDVINIVSAGGAGSAGSAGPDGGAGRAGGPGAHREPPALRRRAWSKNSSSCRLASR